MATVQQTGSKQFCKWRTELSTISQKCSNLCWAWATNHCSLLLNYNLLWKEVDLFEVAPCLPTVHWTVVVDQPLLSLLLWGELVWALAGYTRREGRRKEERGGEREEWEERGWSGGGSRGSRMHWREWKDCCSAMSVIHGDNLAIY